MAAAQQAVSCWLDNNGHGYQTVYDPGGMLHIRSTDPDKQWQIRFTPHSPLATNVVVDGDRDMFQGLGQYLQGRNRKTTVSADQQSEIPAAVLEQIGTVACLRANQGVQTVQFSGVFIDNEGLILSTAHDLNEYEEVTVVSTINTLFHGDIIKIDFKRDLALIQIKTDKDQVVNLEEGRSLLGMGEKVYSIGCPVGLRGTVNAGYINGPPRMMGDQPMWQASMEVQHGSSGSPVFDGSGALVAIVKGRHRVSAEIGFLIPMESIIDFLSEQVEE